jgi:hypothetical protein
VEGELSIRAAKGLKLYKGGAASDARKPIPVAYQDGRYRIRLERGLATYWLVLE